MHDSVKKVNLKEFTKTWLITYRNMSKNEWDENIKIFPIERKYNIHEIILFPRNLDYWQNKYTYRCIHSFFLVFSLLFKIFFKLLTSCMQLRGIRNKFQSYWASLRESPLKISIWWPIIHQWNKLTEMRLINHIYHWITKTN